MLGRGQSLHSQFDQGTLTIRGPKNLRTQLADVLKVD